MVEGTKGVTFSRDAALLSQFVRTYGGLDFFMNSLLQRRSVSEHKEKLHKDEKRGQEKGLGYIIQERWRSPFNEHVRQDLADPAEGLDHKGNLPGKARLDSEYVGRIGQGQEEGGKDRLAWKGAISVGQGHNIAWGYSGHRLQQ